MADEKAVETPPRDPNDPLQRLPRDEAMRAVLASRGKNLEDDIGPATTPQPPAGEAQSGGEGGELNLDPAAQVDRQVAEPVILADEDLSKYRVKVKVNGEERVVTLDEMRASAQKNDAADLYLAEAKQLLHDAKTGKPADAATPPATPPTEPTSTEPDPADAVIDQLFAGNEAEAKRLLREAIKKAAPPAAAPVAPDVGKIVATVEQSIVVRSALRQFAKDHKEIVGDPIARDVADRILSEITEGKPLEAFSEERIGKILDETADRFSKWTQAIAGVPATVPTATTRDEKAARKETIDELPTAATRAASNVPLPKTPSDVIEAMKAARGQVFRDPTRT